GRRPGALSSLCVGVRSRALPQGLTCPGDHQVGVARVVPGSARRQGGGEVVRAGDLPLASPDGRPSRIRPGPGAPAAGRSLCRGPLPERRPQGRLRLVPDSALSLFVRRRGALPGNDDRGGGPLPRPAVRPERSGRRAPLRPSGGGGPVTTG